MESQLVEIKEPDNIWVSMSLCWSENAQIYNKASFPYTLGNTFKESRQG